MIQRIQTVYFLAIVVLSCLVFFLPVVCFYDLADASFLGTLNYQGFVFGGGSEINVLNNLNTWLLKIISALVPLIALTAMFLYKKRPLQIRLSFINMILMLGYYAVLFITLIQSANHIGVGWKLNIPAAFPLVCIILSWLAIRAIKKDEALVKSLNRLR